MSLRRHSLVALAALAVAGASSLPAVGAEPATEGGTALPDGLQKVIVAYDGDVTATDLEALEAVGVTRGFELRSIDAVAVTAAPDVITELVELPGVIAVQPQRRIVLDLYASKQQIFADTITEPTTYERDGGSFDLPGYDGTGVTVGVIDSGIFSEHPGLSGKVTTGLNFEFTEVQDQGLFTVEQWDQYAEATGITALQDEVGHGTHVAGTIGGTGAGSQTYTQAELAGVAPGASFVSLKIASAANGVLDDFGFEENALFAIDYLIRHRELGVTVTNNSWGLLPEEPSTFPLEETDYDSANEMVKAATAAGITMVFSAGNDGRNGPGSIRPGPGAVDAILVAAGCKKVDSSRCTEDEVIVDFSSHGNPDGSGPQVDVTAPGDTIMAPVSPNAILTPLTECRDQAPAEPMYYCISGTSMASPHVAGVVAVMQQANPDLTPAEIEQCLKDTAVDLVDPDDEFINPGFDIKSGFGMVDTAAAVACGTGVSPTSAVEGTVTAPAPEPVEDSSESLPTTGGGLALLGLISVAGARALHRRS